MGQPSDSSRATPLPPVSDEMRRCLNDVAAGTLSTEDALTALARFIVKLVDAHGSVTRRNAVDACIQAAELPFADAREAYGAQHTIVGRLTVLREHAAEFTSDHQEEK